MLLVVEVDVNRALGHAGAFGDLIKRGYGVTVARELGERGLEDFVRALGLAAAARLRARFHHIGHAATFAR